MVHFRGGHCGNDRRSSLLSFRVMVSRMTAGTAVWRCRLDNVARDRRLRFPFRLCLPFLSSKHCTLLTTRHGHQTCFSASGQTSSCWTPKPNVSSSPRLLAQLVLTIVQVILHEFTGQAPKTRPTTLTLYPLRNLRHYPGCCGHENRENARSGPCCVQGCPSQHASYARSPRVRFLW